MADRDDFRALRPALYLAVLFSVCLLALNTLISNGYAAPFIPPPDTTAEGFVKALGAHRYEAALDLLDESLAEQVTVEDLRDLASRLEAAHGGIEQAVGIGDEVGDDAATARVWVLLDDGAEETLEFPLKREDTLWKLASFDALPALAR